MPSSSKKLSDDDTKRLNTIIAQADNAQGPELDENMFCLCCRRPLPVEPKIIEKRNWYKRDIRECPLCKKSIVPCMNSCGRYYSSEESFNRFCPSCMAYTAKKVSFGIVKFTGQLAKEILKKSSK